MAKNNVSFLLSMRFEMKDENLAKNDSKSDDYYLHVVCTQHHWYHDNDVKTPGKKPTVHFVTWP